MKFALASFLLVACVPPTNPPATDSPEDPSLPDPNGGTFEIADPEEPSFLTIEAPQAAAGARSLFTATFPSGAPISEVIRTDTAPREIVVQRIVTTTDTQVELAIELPPPTGSFTRAIVSDTHQVAQVGETVLCKAFNGAVIVNNQHLCVTTAPATRETVAEGPITASQWTLAVVDELTGTPLSTCTTPEPNHLACVLPPRAGLAYRIVVSANGFANLWDGTPGFGEHAIEGVGFTGAILAALDHQCFSFDVEGKALSCIARLDFERFTALDRATLELDPISLRISANGVATASASPALTWDAGDDNVPGATF